MPTVLKIAGFRFFFFSNENNEPEHIHVENGDNYAKFWINPVCLAKSVGFSSRDLNKLEKLVEQHSHIFVDKWHEYFGL